ncbi:hypothetical protein JC796_03850 [Delftia acidovorans]|uniref:hypothetical protein n=1 Tax=Delftia acidovorans TaxID=80866 RepID=UPI0018E74C7F|nr:hypothetical protein [Delftia acidovorans]MBJ2139854.1 hypothetical protein [Delftia acidovorans]
MSENQLLVEALQAIIRVKSTPEFCLFNQFDSEWLCMTKAELSGWFQAVGSAVAIFVAVRIANSQHEKQIREKHLRDANQNLQYAVICDELCLAVESIARFGKKEWEAASSKICKFNQKKFHYHIDRATSTYRLENLQSSILSLLQKEMPSVLMTALFSLQKNLAIYASAISMHHHNKDRFEQLDFYQAQKELNDEIAKLKLAIGNYIISVQEEAGRMA